MTYALKIIRDRSQFCLCSLCLNHHLDIFVDCLLEQGRLLSCMESLLLVPVLLLHAGKVLSLNEKTLGIPESLKIITKQLFEAWNLADI